MSCTNTFLSIETYMFVFSQPCMRFQTITLEIRTWKLNQPRKLYTWAHHKPNNLPHNFFDNFIRYVYEASYYVFSHHVNLLWIAVTRFHIYLYNCIIKSYIAKYSHKTCMKERSIFLDQSLCPETFQVSMYFTQTTLILWQSLT